MCFERSQYRKESAEDVRGRRLWDLFHRETEENEPPVPIAERDDEQPVTEREPEEVRA